MLHKIYVAISRKSSIMFYLGTCPIWYAASLDLNNIFILLTGKEVIIWVSTRA